MPLCVATSLFVSRTSSYPDFRRSWRSFDAKSGPRKPLPQIGTDTLYPHPCQPHPPNVQNPKPKTCTSGGRKFCRTCISCVSGGRGVRGSAFSVAWPAEEFPRCFKHILLFCSDGGLKILRAPETHLVEESMGVGGLHVHGGISPGCDELSSWRSMNSRTDSSARHVRVKVAGQTRPYSCCVCPKQARQAQADTCTEMLPCRKFARVPVHVEWGGSFMLSGVGAA